VRLSFKKRGVGQGLLRENRFVSNKGEGQRRGNFLRRQEESKKEGLKWSLLKKGQVSEGDRKGGGGEANLLLENKGGAIGVGGKPVWGPIEGNMGGGEGILPAMERHPGKKIIFC